MANFKGFKQVLKSEFDAATDKVGYLWFVRENAEATMGEIYFGSRLYGKCSNVDLGNYYNRGEIDAFLANKLEASALEPYAEKTALEAVLVLVNEVMNLIGLSVEDDAIKLILSDSFDGAKNVVAALELLAGKLTEHELAAEERLAAVEAKVGGFGITTEVRGEVTYVQLVNGGEVVSEFDASQFVLDGMLDGARMEGNMLVLSFNTDAGKEDIEVDLSNIIKSYVFDESQFVLDGNNVTLNGEYIKGLVAAAQSGLTVVKGKGIEVNYTTNEEGSAIVTVSAKVADNVEGNFLGVDDNGLYAIIVIDGEDVEE